MEKQSFHYGKNEDCHGLSVDGLPLEALLYEALRPNSTKDTRESRRLIFYFYAQTVIHGGTIPTSITNYIASLLIAASNGSSIDQIFMPHSQKGTSKPSETKSRTEAKWAPSPAYNEALTLVEAISPDLPRDTDGKPMKEGISATSYEKTGETLGRAVAEPDKKTGNRPFITGSKIKRLIGWQKHRAERLLQAQAILNEFYADSGPQLLDQQKLITQLKELYLTENTD